MAVDDEQPRAISERYPPGSHVRDGTLIGKATVIVHTDGPSNDMTDGDGGAVVSLRSGMMVRVVNPRSQHYGNTGHLLGRNEQQEPYWLVRFTTSTAPVHLLEEEMTLVR